MKILLIDPPFYRILGFYNRYFPVGIATIGTFLKQAGHEVVIYDADCNYTPRHMDYSLLPQSYPEYLRAFTNEQHPVWKEVESVVAKLGPAMVGISIWTTFAASAFHVARLCKKAAPNCTVVMGGPHATARAEEILKIAPDVDYVIRGDGELATLELAKHTALRQDPMPPIAGLSGRDKRGIVHHPVRAPSEPEPFPFPDRSLLMNEGRYTSEDMGLVMSSRGCPCACSYCATSTRRVDYRPIDHVVDEITLVRARYGTTLFSFKDDSFTVNRRRVERFCDTLISERLNIHWECNTRVDLITENMLAKMKEAGCIGIKVGIESGSERILKKMHKGVSLDQVRSAAKLLKRAGIFWTGYFMMGVPDETVDEVRQTLELMYDIEPDFASLSVYEPFPGTPMFAEGVEKGLFDPDMTMESFYTTLPNDYYKRTTAKTAGTIDAAEFVVLAKEMKSLFHAHNKSVKRVLRRARSRIPIYVEHPNMLWGDCGRFLRWR